MQAMFVEVKYALGEPYLVAKALVELEGVFAVYSILGFCNNYCIQRISLKQNTILDGAL